MQVVKGRTENLCMEGGIEDMLRTMMLDGAGTPRRLKTFVAELDGQENPVSGRGGIWWDSRPAGTDGVSIVTCHDSAGALPACEMVLDRRPGRFCLVHTAEEDAVAGSVVSALARTTRLNRAWVCPSVMEGIAGGRGGHGRNGSWTARMRQEDGDGHAVADVRCDGTLAHAGGESVSAHLRMAGNVLAASARMCTNAERFRIGASDTPAGTRFDLTPIEIRLSRSIDDVPKFVHSVLDGEPPLLMMGKAVTVEGGQYSVPTMDIECSHHMGMDISPDLVRVGLHHGCSGSGVLRLLACLQLSHDPALRCEQVTSGVCGA